MSDVAVSDFETSQSTEKLDAAMAKAQAELHAAAKDKVNPAFRSKYADLTSVWDACRAALSKYGIAVTQWPVHSMDGRLHIITRLACGGEWMRCHFSLPVGKPDAHGYGSATTYARRFSLAAAVGVVADEDDDGNHASEKPAVKAASRTAEVAAAIRAQEPAPTTDAAAPPSFVSFGAYKGRSLLSMNDQELTAAIAEGQQKLDGNKGAKWADALSRNIAALQEELETRMPPRKVGT